MKKILVILGTRPEAIKLAPLIIKLVQEPTCEVCLCATGQHTDLVDEVLDLFKILPDHQLSVMQEGQSLASLSARLFSQLDPVFIKEVPDWAIVHGDTTTATVASLVSYYHKVKVCHVEAGLRTQDKWSPYPEEINRQVIARVTDLNCAPTESAKKNLIQEGINPETIVVTGNTIVDSIHYITERSDSTTLRNYWPQINTDKRLILITIHRRENQGVPISNILKALHSINATNPDIQLVFVLHPNPAITNQIKSAFSTKAEVMLLPAQPYDKFVVLMSYAYLIITDSGGIQEEAPTLRKPVVVLRSETERKESLAEGIGLLVGADGQSITSRVQQLLDDSAYYQSLVPKSNPYGDGKASKRIMEQLVRRG